MSALMIGSGGLAAPDYEVIFQGNVPMQTRDGVTLYSDIYRPKADGKFPVLLERTPYNKYSNIDSGLKGAARGYVVILQDVRGRSMSGGDWYAFKSEGPDGYDAVEWAAALPYSNGKVAMIGGSYVGATQMLAAITTPPHLVAIFPEITGSNYFEHWAYQGGAFMQMLAQAWSSALAIDQLQRQAGASASPAHWDYLRPPGLYPMLDPGTAKGLGQFYFDWLAHPTYDAYWKQWAIDENFDKITVPALHVAAWYDLFQDGSIRNYVGIKAHGGSAAARAGQRLIIIPGGHAGFDRKIGEVDFGAGSVLDLWGYGLRWFDYVVKGIDNGIEHDKPVKIFVMGTNVWQEEDTWPLARARATRYYLRSGGAANSLTGNGVLSEEAPATETADHYVYDPAHPVPTHGGGTLGDTANFPPGPFDQRKVENRPDVLVYTTPPLAEDVKVIGPVTLQLYVSSSAVDTDFTGKLVDVFPDGRAINLTDGILRARFRDSREHPTLMQPGQVYAITVSLWSTANVFRAGHRIRLEVASSNFPRYDRNPNTGSNLGADGYTQPATNVIYHDAAHPSALTLPIIPAEPPAPVAPAATQH